MQSAPDPRLGELTWKALTTRRKSMQMHFESKHPKEVRPSNF